MIPQPTAQNVQIVGIRLAFRTCTRVGALFSPMSDIPDVTASRGDTPAILRKSRLVKDNFDILFIPILMMLILNLCNNLYILYAL